LNNNMFSKAAVWLVIALVLFTVFKQFDKPRVQEGVSYSQFMDDAKNGKVKNVIVQGRNLTVTPSDGQKYQIVSPGDIWMVGDLMKYGVQVSGKADDEPNALVSALYYLGRGGQVIGMWILLVDLFTAGPLGPNPKLFATGVAISGGWIDDWASSARNRRHISLLSGSAKLSDYRLEFQAQIESKAIGWIFRGLNPRNYYVTKLEIVTPGLEPTVASLLRRPAGRLAFDDVDLALLRIPLLAVSELTGQ